jgi:hypothetical protein
LLQSVEVELHGVLKDLIVESPLGLPYQPPLQDRGYISLVALLIGIFVISSCYSLQLLTILIAIYAKDTFDSHQVG